MFNILHNLIIMVAYLHCVLTYLFKFIFDFLVIIYLSPHFLFLFFFLSIYSCHKLYFSTL